MLAHPQRAISETANASRTTEGIRSLANFSSMVGLQSGQLCNVTEISGHDPRCKVECSLLTVAAPSVLPCSRLDLCHNTEC